MEYRAGQVIKIGWYGYCHYAVVSDRRHADKPMLISHSRRTGTVEEEPWDAVVQGKRVRASRLRSGLEHSEVVRRARSQVGERRYHLLKDNCEHFARESLGLPPKSRQLQGAAASGLTVLVVALRLARLHPALGLTATVAAIIIGSRSSAR